jgi:hypothetical protein
MIGLTLYTNNKTKLRSLTRFHEFPYNDGQFGKVDNNGSTFLISMQKMVNDTLTFKNLFVLTLMLY